MHKKVLAGAISVLAGVMACSRQDTQQSTKAPPAEGAKQTITRSLEYAESSVTRTRRPTFTAADWDRAAASIVKLQPRYFRDLPAAIVGELERRGCTIPQTAVPGTHNVINGRFTRATQLDWAVLCSHDERSTILVFRNAASDDVTALAPAEDRGFLQGMGGSLIGYSRQIGVADAGFIRAMNDQFGHVTLPQLDHDGINDAFIEKASTVHYWNGKQWLRLAGVD